ncbi:hypothetical protein [Profundibacterium mesophilum]|uniref:Uncharacterized protein n=1 Tax=Profundibacterium mesophilum KAUST100406-0324 TaxID=1037889 RepID=A0A921TCF7_9RHOB|nr:hypothetical protein [Profundibacterium mesophilum]KAF0675076.1 hypothetical protein PMES_02597 [Profundibacterium mesophilum KAUST100406-0324]
MSGAKIAAEVTAGIRAASAEVGNGKPLRITILRDGPRTGQYPFTVGPDQSFEASAVQTERSTQDRASSAIRLGDVKLLVAADAEVEPQTGDRVRVAGRVYGVESVKAYASGGVVRYYTVQAREAGQDA